MGKNLALYTGLRVVAFVGCYGVLLVLNVRGLLAILVALLLSSLLSLFLLRRPRDTLSAALQQRADARAQEKARLRSMLDGDRPGSSRVDGSQ